MLITPAVSRAARITDPDELAVELGSVIAARETHAFDWPVPAPLALARLTRALR